MPIDEVERARRRRLMQAHIDAENAHDLPAIMATFSDDADQVFNGARQTGAAAIARGYVALGFSNEPGTFENLRCEVVRDYFTAEEIILEGVLVGKFVRPQGFLFPTHAEVRLPFITAYRFDAADKLVHERVVMNFGGLDTPAEGP